MAKNKNTEENKMVKVEALVYLKYDKECFKIGDNFEVGVEDIEDMTGKGYVKALEIIIDEQVSEEGE